MPPKLSPPRFEISDMGLSETDPRYAAAVRCVETYWKQATCLTEAQILSYLGYLNRKNISDYIPISALTAEPDTLEARASNHRLYPDLSGQGLHRQRDCLDCVYVALIILFNINKTAEASTSTPSTTQPAVPGAWSIDNVIDTMSPSNRKRLGSEHERSAKRARVESSELLKKVNQQTEGIQKAIDLMQENQETRLQDMREAIEENKQALGAMQSELRQFMSAVATTLRSIQERLDE
ncbi:hypothetical protein TgHK011_003293 [Trichoderma gracile]|nr:hypothetical protein TgHK011_003293 [Trichoderma gracile]